jgi:hypothetical protein
MITKEAIKEMFDAGRRIMDDQYCLHLSINYLKTFYHDCKRLSNMPKERWLSSRDLSDYINSQVDGKFIARRHRAGKKKFNPQGWLGAAWSGHKKSPGSKMHFNVECWEVLLRDERKPYSYSIQPECYEMVRAVFAEQDASDKRLALDSEASDAEAAKLSLQTDMASKAEEAERWLLESEIAEIADLQR